MTMQKIKQSVVLVFTVLLLLMIPVNVSASAFPDIVDLPAGFRPEGIAVGRGSTFFAGSLADGRVLRGDLRTGISSVLVPGQAGMLSVGMYYDGRSDALFVAGGPSGGARVFNATTGELLQSYQFASPGSFINDVVVTDQAAFFTNSFAAEVYKLPLGPQGSLPPANGFVVLPLSGDWSQIAGFNANGIEASSDGAWLVVVNSTVGKLYRVDPWSGMSTEIDLGGESVSAGDGIRFRGSNLYVMRNNLNEIVAIDLSEDLTSGVVIDTFSNPNFDVPTTLAVFGDALYAVNAKFNTLPTPATPYEIVRVELH
jgi:sugar lactone lactonase YvrE